MIRSLERLSDRMLELVLPSRAAAAETCWVRWRVCLACKESAINVCCRWPNGYDCSWTYHGCNTC